ncbi:Carboxylesterase family-domain-containing protein [Amylostereum chailletii]|nr:Carboxylesterase family-domain-containing protein [Amylostereum chailletii]
MRTLLALTLYTLRAVGQATQGPVVNTTSGRFIGVENDGGVHAVTSRGACRVNVSISHVVQGHRMSSIGVAIRCFSGTYHDIQRFGEAPVGDLRWSTPQASFSNQTQNATFFAPSCIQQFAFATQEFITDLFNNPPVPESEDCLFLNVWAPTTYSGNTLKPVVVWVYGGSLAFGTSSFPLYDGTSFAKNQDIVVVSFNYRTNIFGFPQSPDLALLNLGFLDQELAFQWVQENIKQFGGDKERVTIMGESAGAESVSLAIARHTPTDAPFRAGIMFSGASVSSTPRYNFSAFNNFASAAGCTQATGSPARLQCLKAIPTGSIRNFTNGPTSGSFGAIVDNVTMTTLCKVFEPTRRHARLSS